MEWSLGECACLETTYHLVLAWYRGCLETRDCASDKLRWIKREGLYWVPGILQTSTHEVGDSE